jgi:hypothetical protein
VDAVTKYVLSSEFKIPCPIHLQEEMFGSKQRQVFVVIVYEIVYEMTGKQGEV